MKEIWEDIPNYEGLYQASNLGRIRSVDRYKEVIIKNQHGEYKRTKFFKSYILKQQTYIGYKCVQLHINGKYKWEKAHRLVAMAFVPNPENKPQVNHIDGNKINNCVENLEWCNQSYNTKHAYKNNLIKHYKIEINQYDLEGNYIKTWESVKEIEKKLKIKNSQICRCCKNENLTAGGYHWQYYKIK